MICDHINANNSWIVNISEHDVRIWNKHQVKMRYSVDRMYIDTLHIACDAAFKEGNCARTVNPFIPRISVS